MEFKISVDELQSIVTRLTNVVQMNEENITGQVLVEVGDEIKFKATSGSVSMMITAEEAEIITKGRGLFKLRDVNGYVMKFIPLMENYGTKEFHFIVDNDKGMIKTKTFFQSNKPAYKTLKFEIYNKDFPVLKPFGEAQLIINSNVLKQGINRVLHCVNPSEVRQAITGVSTHLTNDKIVFAGTNGVKLAEFEVPINTDIENTYKVLSYNFASVLRTTLDDDAQVFVIFEGRNVYVKSNNLYISGTLIVGEDYPDYKPMFDLTEVIQFPRIAFSDTIHSVMDVLDVEDNSRLTINFDDKTLTIANDRVESVQTFDESFAKDLDIDVNGEFLDSLLRNFIGENLQIHFTEGNNYLVFKSPDNEKHVALLTVIKRR